MSSRGNQRPVIRSSLVSDPELGDLVKQFVIELPGRVAWLRRHLDAGDWESLRRAAHQMKGAAGSYGFEGLAPHACHLESLVAAGASRKEITSAVGELVAHCRLVRATGPD